MTEPPRDGPCEEMSLLVQADFDGELDAAGAAVLATHVRDCPQCSALAQELAALSGHMRAELPRYAAPAALRDALEARLVPAVAPPRERSWRRYAPVFSFGAGAAIAAGLVLALIPAAASDPGAELVASHIRALQPGHLTDVVSSDQHTVKPWFDGRIDYAPPVRDLAAEGFPLLGGRLDYLGGRPVAALVYRHDKHQIDLYVWPGGDGSKSSDATINGYNIVRWSQGGMQFRAVSDLEANELADFARRWQAAT